jgi:hypothetical protein
LQPNSNRESTMTTASRSLATAPLTGALRERLAPPSYTTNGDTTGTALIGHLVDFHSSLGNNA